MITDTTLLAVIAGATVGLLLCQLAGPLWEVRRRTVKRFRIWRARRRMEG